MDVVLPEDDDALPPLGVVPLESRGSLPYVLVHGESLVASASWALTEAGAELFDWSLPFAAVAASGRPLVVHDPLCPLTPPEFIAEAIARSAETGAVVVGVLTGPDGAELVASPVVLPASALGHVAAGSGLMADLALLVSTLEAHHDVERLDAPALAGRVADESDIAMLEALSERADG